MRILLGLIFLFILLPWLELAILIELARRFGLLETFILVIFTGVLGASLARTQGLNAVRRIQAAVAEGRLPTTEIVDGFLIFCAGLVLITPGMITDAIGFALLIPQARLAVRNFLINYFKGKFTIHTPPNAPPDDNYIIDVEADVVEDDHEVK